MKEALSSRYDLDISLIGNHKISTLFFTMFLTDVMKSSSPQHTGVYITKEKWPCRKSSCPSQLEDFPLGSRCPLGNHLTLQNKKKKKKRRDRSKTRIYVYSFIIPSFPLGKLAEARKSFRVRATHLLSILIIDFFKVLFKRIGLIGILLLLCTLSFHQHGTNNTRFCLDP